MRTWLCINNLESVHDRIAINIYRLFGDFTRPLAL